ncbi:MAG: protein of unknown function with transrane region [Candidatus Nomurabacteria bacterium]|nr:protein of unknown function with transrane region [Candidatus Nomurabacteria bacterium]
MNDSFEENSALDSIEHQLYDPKKKEESISVHRVKNRREVELPTSWGENTQIIKELKKNEGLSFGAKFLIISGIILLLALLFTSWRILSSRNIVSSNNIEMTADVAPTISGGEEIPVTVTIHNKNSVLLESASLTLIYKQGVGSQDQQEKVQEKRVIGTINPDEYKKQDFKITLYGSEAEARDVTLKLDYKVSGSNAIFSKTITSSVVLKTPPLSIVLSGPDTLSADQNGDFSMIVTNNTATTSLPSLLLLTLPANFTFNSSSPKQSGYGPTWQIPAIESGSTYKIGFSGALSGSGGETGTMKAIIGSQGGNINTIGIVYSSQVYDIHLRSSPLSFKVALDTDRGQAETLRYGDSATLTITYTNSSDTPIQNVKLTLNIDGDAPLYNQIDPGTGYYDSASRTITWDKSIIPDFQSLPPHKESYVRVVIPIVLKGTNSPSLKVGITGAGSLQSSNDVVAKVNKSWVVQGSATINAETHYKISTFTNTGPIPPVVNKDTTYTAHIVVSAQNALVNSKVSFVLPIYVSWRGVTSDNAAITYEPNTRTVTWNIGRIDAGKTTTGDIGLTVKPSQSHAGKSPSITSGIVLDADEETSKAHLRTTISALTTKLSNESLGVNSGIVVDK